MPTEKPFIAAPKKPKYSRAEVTAIFERFKEANPEPKGELNHVNPFTLVVAVALSAQATDIGVNKATKALFEIADSPQKKIGRASCRERV